MKEGRMRISYVVTDYVATLAGVVIFSIVRFYCVSDIQARFASPWQFMGMHGVVMTMLLFPPVMLLIYYLTGYYVKPYNKSRIAESVKTLIAVVIGALVYFFGALVNDILPSRTLNYEVLLILVGVLFVCVYTARVSLTTHYLRKIRRPGGGRKAVLVVEPDVTKRTVSDLIDTALQHGITVTAWADMSGGGAVKIFDGMGLKHVDIKDIRAMKSGGEVSCVLLADDTLSADSALSAISKVLPLGMPVYVSPGMKAMVMGTVRYDHVLANPLVDISCSDLTDSVVAVKRFLDIVLSSLGLVVSLPVMAVLGVVIKIQSRGPVVYSQERIGYRGRPFMLYKMRSMCEHAEPDGPRLASPGDARITPIGRVMRKYRLDELPNLWNVLKGDMSIVGPRPERRYFIDRIIERAPHYVLVHQVRPGLTSWGMVKYGYAGDVEGMVERLKYDMLYLQNLSLSLDIRIIYYTLFTVLRGEGK